MVGAFDEFKVVGESRSANSLIIHKNCCHAIHDAFLHLVLKVNALDMVWPIATLIVPTRKHFCVHLKLDTFSMQDTSRPVAYNAIVVA